MKLPALLSAISGHLLSPVVFACALLSVSTSSVFAQERVVVLCLIDGLELTTAKVAAENGATNLKFIFENGVVAEETYCTTPVTKIILENKSEPWGGTTSPNIAVHTGCHIFESRTMDDIFLAAREKSIKSVFAGGSRNYNVITTPNFYYSGDNSDQWVVQKGIDHFKNDGTRLIRLHLQRIRDAWKGPSSRTDPKSGYIKAVIAADNELGRLIKVLKDEGVWDSTYLIVTSDHGMGNSSASNHPPEVLSSWSMFMGFYGPDIKRGETIPYAESPDLATLTAHLLDLRPLKGNTDPKVSINPKGTNGTLLTNIFVGAPRELNHPRPILNYFKSVNMKPGKTYLDYRNGVVPFLQLTTGLPDAGGSRAPAFQKNVWIGGKFHYSLESSSYVKICIVNLKGELVRDYVSAYKTRGMYHVDFEHLKVMLKQVACPGKYFLRINFDGASSIVGQIPFGM